VQQSLFADSARNRELQTLALNPSAQHSTIEYFSKDVDREVVAKALVEGGLKFSNATARIIDDPTNSIWAGDKVPLADVRFVALTFAASWRPVARRSAFPERFRIQGAFNRNRSRPEDG